MTTPYIDPNLIFAENAPVQDKPAAFSNYDKGWDESRKNDGRPLIPQMNYLTQQADLKNLYIHENGAALPYKEGIAYEENAVVVKDGVLQQLKGGVWKASAVSKYVTVPTYKTAADGVNPVTGVADGAYFNVQSEDDDTVAIEYQNVGGSAVATGKSYLSALGVQLQEKSAATIKDVSGLTQQEINSYTVFPEFFGAVGGDAEKDTKAFQDAIAAGANLTLASGKNYHIKCDDFVVGAGNDLRINGTSNAQITLVAGTGTNTAAFDITNANAIVIKGVRITTADNVSKRMFTVGSESFINEFDISDGCDFQNSALLIRGIGSTTRMPLANPYGFKSFKFIGNTAKNILGSFCVLPDIPIYNSEIYGNEVTNFKNIFFHFGITNASLNHKELYQITSIDARKNKFKSDDDFWANGISGLYYTPLLAEGKSVIWSDNEVNGLKTEDNVSVYDAYLMCLHVTSNSNIVKNFGSFHTSEDNNAFMHAKLDKIDGLDTPTKQFIGNNYSIEKAWLTRIGKTSIRHRLFNFGVINSGVVTVRGNIINANIIRPSHVNSFEKFTWDTNPIAAVNNIDPNFLQIGPALDSGCNAYIRNFEVTLEAAQSQLCLMRPINNVMFWDVLEITNPIINAPTSTVTNNMLLSGVKAKKASVFGVRYNAPLHTEYSVGCQFKELYADNNIYYSTRSIGAWIGRYRDIFGASNAKETVTGLVKYHHIQVHSSLTEPPTKLSQRFTVNVEIEWGLSSEVFGFSYVLEYAPASNKYIVKFINESDVEIVADVNSGQSNGVYIKVSKPVGSTFRAILRNLQSETYFDVLNIPQEPCRYTAQVISF